MTIIDVVVRCRNEMPHVPRALDALARQVGVRPRVHFFDCGSSDGSREVALDRGVRLLDVDPASYRPGAVLNRAMSETSSDIVAFVNADAIALSEDALAALITPLVADSSVAATFGRQIARPRATSTVQLDYRRAFGAQEPVKLRRGHFFSMAASAVRRTIWEEVPFDEQLPTVFCFNDDWLLAHRPGEGSSRARRWLWSAAERAGLSARTWRGVDIERAVYVSGATREALRLGGAPEPEGTVAWQGVCLLTFAARPFRPVGDSPRLLFAGRVHPTKGCDIAIETLAELARSGVRATLSVAGSGEPSELARLRLLAQQLEVSEQVQWLGFVPRQELGALYRASDVFLFPSRWNEPAGLTYLEAMSCGVPVIAMPTGGARELLAHEDNSLHVSDARSMAHAATRLMRDPSLAQRLVEGAHRTLRERASLDRYIATIDAELQAAARSVPHEMTLHSSHA